MRIGLKAFLAFFMPVVLIMALGAQSMAEDANAERGANFYKKCIGCHTAKPKFGGKPMDYLTGKLMHFRDGSFDKAKIVSMQKSLEGLSDQDIKDLAAYINKM